MPEHYGSQSAPKKKKANALSASQKEQLKKHMDKLKEGGMEPMEIKSHRMKMMTRMKKGMSVKEAHKDIGK